jgi:putative selenate reductase molybdopterin-binding subunit
MELELRINGVVKSLEVASNESLMTVLRREGYFSVKHGCETGECGACTVLVDGLPRPSCVMLAAQAGGCTLQTVESLVSGQQLHPLQEAFIETGAVQCGFCTPGMLLSAYSLLQRNSRPTEDEVRDALSGNLCRCTGYVKSIQAVKRAAASLRGESESHTNGHDSYGCDELSEGEIKDELAVGGGIPGYPQGATLQSTLSGAERSSIFRPLVTGKPVFADDIELRHMLHGRLLTSPHAHAHIRRIDVSQARALPGVHAVLTYRDIKRVPFTAAGLSGTEDGPHDQYCLDDTVRFVGDRVAAVAAETSEVAEQALDLIRVDYEVLPTVLDPRQAIEPDAPRLHAEADSYGIYNASRNVAAHIQTEVGNVDRGFAESDFVVEGEYIIPQVQQTPIENHVVITYWDEDERLVVRSSTEAPQHVRRVISPLIGLPPKRIRVVKTRVGGSFGVKQDVLLEDICALLTIATNRSVRLELSRVEEFTSSRTRHADIVRMKTGVKSDGTLVANSMTVLSNTGAYGMHALNILRDMALQTLPLYACPNMRVTAQAVYTNVPPAGAFRGYGTPQGCFALESQMDEVARHLGMDALELRRKNWLTAGNDNPLTRSLAGSAGNPVSRVSAIQSCELPRCLQIVEEKLGWKEKRGREIAGRFRRGVGVAIAMQGSAGSGLEMSEASTKLNEDGSFNLLVGATDSDILLTQIAAEVLEVPATDIILPSVDTDHLPFDSGGNTSPYVSGNAVKSAAQRVREQILAVASRMLRASPQTLTISDGVISAPNGEKVTFAQVALYSQYVENQPQIMERASWASDGQPSSFAAQGVEVEVDTETGEVRILKAVSAVDAGDVINPIIAEAQIEGGVAQALGSAVCEELVFNHQGVLVTTNLSDYRIFSASDVPPMESYLVESGDAGGSFGARSISGVVINAMAPAVANAVADALGIRLYQLPLTPERLLRAIHAANARR